VLAALDNGIHVWLYRVAVPLPRKKRLHPPAGVRSYSG
jgi:hypothetical protein